MLRQRDRRIIKFIESGFGCASTAQLHTIFFGDVSLRRCQQRLKMLVKQRQLRRFRGGIGMDYVYYLGKQPSAEVRHMLTRVDYYIAATKKYVLTAFEPEYDVGKMRADAYYEVWHPITQNEGYVEPFFLEVHLSRHFRQEKYERYYHSGEWRDRWDDFPTVIILTDCVVKIKESDVKYQIVECS